MAASGGVPAVPGVSDVVYLAKGGYAEVYQGRQAHLDRPVAVKVFDAHDLDDAARRSFERECRALGELDGARVTGIVPIFGAAILPEPDGRPYLLMQLCDGGSLRDRLRGRRHLPAGELCRLGAALGDTLAQLHATGLLHRDVSPGNVLFHDERPLLADFGLSLGEHWDITRRQTSLTRAFAAPETLGRGRATAASDVYSLGATLYVAASGTPPLRPRPDESETAFAHRCRTEVPARLADTPDAVADLIATMLAKNPADRPDAARVRDDFLAAAGTPAEAAGTQGTAPGSVAAGPPAPTRVVWPERLSASDRAPAPGDSPDPATSNPPVAGGPDAASGHGVAASAPDDGDQALHAVTERARPEPPPPPSTWRRWLLPGSAAVAGAVLTVLAIALVTGARVGDPGLTPTPVAGTPATAGTAGADAEPASVTLDEPQVTPGQVRLTWQGPPDVQYGLLMAAEDASAAPEVEPVGMATSVSVPIEDDTGYCAQIHGQRHLGGDVYVRYVSGVVSIAGATCRFEAEDPVATVTVTSPPANARSTSGPDR